VRGGVTEQRAGYSQGDQPIPPMLGGGEADISPGEDSFALTWSVRY
jgi:hypothetical protein